MTSLERLVRLFVAEPAVADGGSVPAPRAAPPPQAGRPATIALLAPAREAPAAAAALVAAMLQRRAPAVLVCRWEAAAVASEVAEAPQALALPGARRIATDLVAAGLEAVARGRTATVALPADAAAAADATRVAFGRVAAPALLVLAGPRPPAFDELLAAHDRIVVALPAGAAGALQDVALEDAAALGPPAALLRIPGGSPRLMATLIPPSLRRAAAGALA